MIVGVCRLSLYFSESGSLKSKRQPLRRVIDRLRAKFNAAVAEVADQDTWQRATIGIAVVGNESRHVQSMLDTMIGFVEQQYVAEILDRQTELVTYSDGERLDLPLWVDRRRRREPAESPEPLDPEVDDEKDGPP
jgi:uncharacterized protein YlxP (DUF503 family)